MTAALLARLATYRRTRTARGATLGELTLLDDVSQHVESLDATATRRMGLSRELEVELFGAVQPILADRAEAVTTRALQVIRDLKRAAQEREHLHQLAVEASDPKSTGRKVRHARDELVRVCLSHRNDSGQLAQGGVHDRPECKAEHQTQHEALPISKRSGLQPDAEGNDRDDRAEQAEPELEVHNPHATELQHRFDARLTDELTRGGAQ